MDGKAFYAAYETDAKAEDEGTWTPLRGGAEAKVRSEHSLTVREAARKLDKKYRAIIMTEGGLPPETQDQRDIELTATAVLVDWKNVPDPDNHAVTLPFSPENARKVLTRLRAMLRDIQYASRIDETFRKAEVEKLKGN